MAPPYRHVGLKSSLSPITNMNLCLSPDLAMSLDRSAPATDTLAMQLSEAKPVHLIHVNPEVNMARFYGIDIQPTLFGEMSVLRSWGRIGTKGRAMMVTFEDATQATEALKKLDKQKRRRGYVAVTD